MADNQPKPPKIDEQISYNWLFFLLAGAFGAVTFWAVYDETATRREYKNYQEAFFNVESELNARNLKLRCLELGAPPDSDPEKKAVADACNKVKGMKDVTPEDQKATQAATLMGQKSEYGKLVAKKQQLEAELAGPKKAAFEDAKAKLQEAQFTAFDKGQNYTFTKSNLDETYYYYTKAKHESPGGMCDKEEECKKRKKQLDEFTVKLAGDEKIMNDSAKARDEVSKVAKGFTQPIAELTKQIDKLETDVGDAQRKYVAAVDKQSGMFGPQTEIIQENLETINRVDRCESCHVGSSRSGFELVQPAYFRSHPFRRTLFSLHPPDKFGCTTCHDGQGRATTKFYAHAPVDNPHDAEKHFWEEPLLKGSFMESNCRKCHMDEVDLRSHLKCEVDAECEIPGNPKLTASLKCDFPSTPLNAADTSIPPFTQAADDAHKADEAKYCVNKENNVAELVELSPHLARGRKIIEEVGCYGCHPIEGYEKQAARKPAPDLRHAAAKLGSGWMTEWIKNPKAFHPHTRMPNFFPEEKERAAGTLEKNYPHNAIPVREEKAKDPNLDPWKWTVAQQTAALASFLMAQSTPFEVKKIPVAGDAARGKQLVLNLGCRGCHNITEDEKDPSFIDHKNRASHYDHGPNLSNVGSKVNADWIYTWLKDPKSYAPGTRMPNLRLADQEAADIATYLAGQKDKKEFPANPLVNAQDPTLVASGKKLLNYYGCYGCHFITGFESTAGIGVELTEFGVKDVARLDFGDYVVDHKEQTWSRWLQAKLEHPRVYRYERVDTRMPQFDLSKDEIEDVMVVLKGMRGKNIDGHVLGQVLNPMEKEREQGRELVRWFNCYGCHTIDGHIGDIRQAKEYTKDENAATLAPPKILGEGAKTQPNWLFAFLKNIKPLRPWLNVRMPTFGFEDEQATHLVAMFSALDHAIFPYRYYDVQVDPKSKAIGEAMFKSMTCTSCHVVGDVKLSEDQRSKAAPNLLMAKDRLRPEWIVKWLSDPQKLLPDTKMPSFFTPNYLQMMMTTPDGKKLFGTLNGIEEVAAAPIRQMEILRNFVFNLQGGATQAGTKSSGGKPGKKAEAPTPHATHASL